MRVYVYVQFQASIIEMIANASGEVLFKKTNKKKTKCNAYGAEIIYSYENDIKNHNLKYKSLKSPTASNE